LSGLAGLLLVSQAVAQAPDPKTVRGFEVTPFAGYRIGGTFQDEVTEDELELNDAGSFGLILNLRESPNTEWELMYSHQSTDIDIDGPTGSMRIDMDLDYLQIGGTYLGGGRQARPYMVATLGLAHLDPGSEGLPSDTFFAFTIGGGWKVQPTQRIGLRLEGRFYGTVIDSDSKIFCGSGPSGAGCLINTKAEVLWQFEMSAGLIFRF
jgi:opacity protein-like surface antigen